jgi:hypothetical protein
MVKKDKKAKSAKRSAAGKKRWAAMSASAKAAAIARLRGLRSPKASAGGKAKMAKNKGGGRRRQGIVSWIVNLITLLLAFLRPIQIMTYYQASPVEGLKVIGDEASMGLTSGGFSREKALRFYGPMIGAIVFKTVSGELTKRARVTSLIPALHA